MFSKKKEERPKHANRDRNLAQYGLFDVPTNLSLSPEASEESDSDLESELLALTNGPQPKPRKSKPKPVSAVNLDTMISESLKDIPSDAELSGDSEDSDLLNELTEITGEQEKEEEKKEEGISQLLEKRLDMYVKAEENAKKAGESTRARRFNRGIKTLKDLLKQTNAGKVINTEDIPPEVSTGENIKQPEPSKSIDPIQPEPEVSQQHVQDTPVGIPESSNKDDNKQHILKILSERKNQYKIAALTAKKNQDMQSAINFMKIGKQFDLVLKAVEENQEVDLSSMPGPPEYQIPGSSKTADTVVIEENTKAEDEGVRKEDSEIQTEESKEELINPSNFLQGLIMRMDVYKKQEENAKQEGNSSKARRMGRIIKQYEQAIKAHKSGKAIPLDELPNPPGFVPFITQPESNPITLQPASKQTQPEPIKSYEPVDPQPESSVQSRIASIRKTGNQMSTTHNEKQTNELISRQREFKEAALEAKKKGELAQAKEYLRTAKGFDKVIEAAKCGLPVDMESLPIPPSARNKLEDSFDFVVAEECTEDDTGTLDILLRLEEQLTKQLKLCLTTRDHHKALGDVAGTNRFEHLALTVTKDLDVVRLAHRTNTGIVPKFHYENKCFSVVKCCTDLSDNDFEMNIVRGINYNCTNPKEIDTYVKFEFPYPQEEPVKDKTCTVRDTNNPTYSSTFILPIQRTSRPCLRVFKRQAVKFEVYSKGGFFRSDTLLGTVNVKLQPLETQCELHESYDLMDGRKKVGGKLEIHMRVRNPLVTKQIEQLNEKWLVLDH